jgi:hypothetical protein
MNKNNKKTKTQQILNIDSLAKLMETKTLDSPAFNKVIIKGIPLTVENIWCINKLYDEDSIRQNLRSLTIDSCTFEPCFYEERPSFFVLTSSDISELTISNCNLNADDLMFFLNEGCYMHYCYPAHRHLNLSNNNLGEPEGVLDNFINGLLKKNLDLYLSTLDLSNNSISDEQKSKTYKRIDDIIY